MNFLRKTFSATSQAPKANHGKEFNNKEKQYYELEGMLKKLLKDVKRYTTLWGQLLQCKTAIYGYLLYFYNQKSEKRIIIDDLFKYHTRPMEKFINKLCQEYEQNLEGEIRQILTIFPQTQKLSATLHMKKHQMLSKKQYYQQLKRSNKKVTYSELAEADEQVRILEHAYEFSVRTVIREFEDKVNNKDSILDRFCIRMMESDGKLYSNLFKTSRILRDKSLIFQYYRDYPQGLPSYFRDYSYREDIQSSSDSDITSSPANPFYSDTLYPGITKQNKSRNQTFKINQLTNKHGFQFERVQSVVKQHPNASYEKLLEILTNIKKPQIIERKEENKDNNNDDIKDEVINDILNTNTITLTQPQRSEEDDTDHATSPINTHPPPPPPRSNKIPESPSKSKTMKYPLSMEEIDEERQPIISLSIIQPSDEIVSDGAIDYDENKKTDKSPKRSKTPPPPPKPIHKKKPKPPLSPQKLTVETIDFPSDEKEIKTEILQEGDEGDNEQESDEEFVIETDEDINDIEVLEETPKILKKSKKAVQFARNRSINKRKSSAADVRIHTTRKGRVHSKSVTSPNDAPHFNEWEKNLQKIQKRNVHKTPPPPPPPRPNISHSHSNEIISIHKMSKMSKMQIFTLNGGGGGSLSGPDIDNIDDNDNNIDDNDDQKSKKSIDRTYPFRRSATVDLISNLPQNNESNRSIKITKFKRKRKKPPPSNVKKQKKSISQRKTSSPSPPSTPTPSTPPSPSKLTLHGINNHLKSASATSLNTKSIIVHETGSDRSTSHELPISNTGIADIDSDPDDSLNDLLHAKDNDDDDPSISDGSVPAPSFQRQSQTQIIMGSSPKPPTPATAEHSIFINKHDSKRSASAIIGRNTKKNKPISTEHVQIAQLMKKDNRVPPWIWNKTNCGSDGNYRYHIRDQHPLGLGLHTIHNFRYLHQLLHPRQIRHIGDPNSNAIPNRITRNHVVIKNVNIRKLTLFDNKPKAINRPPIPSTNKVSIRTTSSTQTSPIQSRRPPPIKKPPKKPPGNKSQTQQRKPIRPPPTPPKPQNNNNKQNK